MAVWLWLLACVLCAVPATGVFDALAGGGFTVRDAESARAAARAEERFPAASPDAVILVRGTEPPMRGRALLTAVKRAWQPAAGQARGHGSGAAGTQGPEASLSHDGRAVLLPVVLRGDDEESKRRAFAGLKRAFAAPAGTAVAYGGPIPFLQEAGERSQADLVRAELVAAPLLLVLLIAVFGSATAAALPLCVGAVAVVVALAALRAAAALTEVSVFAVNTVTMIGLGLAIDYALLIVSRFREERRRGAAVAGALSVTLRTAGRTVLVSAGLVGVALAALALFPLGFMRSLAIGGVAVTAAAAAAALTLLPALLTLLGPRLEKGRLPRGRRAAGHPGGAGRPDRRGRQDGAGAGHRSGAVHPDGERGQLFWRRCAVAVGRRPVLWLTLCTAALLLAAAPVLHVTFAGISVRTLPEDSASRQVEQAVRETFPQAARSPVTSVVRLPSPAASAEGQRALRGLLERMRSLESVAGARVVAADGDTALVAVAPEREGPRAGQQAVREVREVRAPPGVRMLTGGDAALDVDMIDALRARLLPVAGVIAAVTFAALALMLRSLLLPVKAVLTSALSAVACLGAMTWVFQDGYLSGPLGFTALGFVEATQPVVVLMVLFALSMDYELFLIARVREEYLRLGDNAAAVVAALQRTSTVITSAALLLLAVIAAFTTSSVIAVKEVGVGLFAGVLLDATLVRLLLVPAALFLAGRANWWAPPVLIRRLPSPRGPAARESDTVIDRTEEYASWTSKPR
ncbi:MMPL family transporter [Streptomyces sp. PR69]|uniref:MMPL family transporter n=1 Tax=Streptomyces sp. PR69 TaxID=2984950 RepID=UPI002264B478|nr:MMPL family transporter [Streptomyces sp. PR69]